MLLSFLHDYRSQNLNYMIILVFFFNNLVYYIDLFVMFYNLLLLFDFKNDIVIFCMEKLA